MRKKAQDKLVAIVVPLSNRETLTPEEEISLHHLQHFLGDYDKYLIMPKTLNFDIPGFANKRFSNHFFGSLNAHQKLLFSQGFYQAFIDYKFILIYHLDALVFSDELTAWCDRNYDLIAPPWIEHKDAPYANKPMYEGKVGNGGFSLRKVESFLKVIRSKVYFTDPQAIWRQYYESKPLIVRLFNQPKKFLHRFRGYNNIRREISHLRYGEDYFFANRATHYYPDFSIAPTEVALQFGFECVPRYCYEKNNYRLPFGCHAWQKYEREFWEPYLLK